MRWIGLPFLFLLSSCTLGTKAQKRNFELNNLWIVPHSEKSNSGFRRLNRSGPVKLQLEKQELIIFGNPYNGIIAVDSAEGNRVWSFHFKHGTEARLATEGNFVFASANDGFVYALDGESGQLLWSYPTRSENIAELRVSQGLVFILSSQNTLYAVEAVSGKRVWIYTRPDGSLFSIRGGGKPAIFQDKLFVGFGDGALVSFKASNGQVLWEREFSVNKRFRDLDSDILVFNDSILVGGFDEAVYRVNIETGLTLWKSEGGMFGSFALLGDTLCYAQTDQNLRCLEASSGKSKFDLPIKAGLATSPRFYKSLLVFGESEGSLQVWDIQNKKRLGEFFSGRGLVASPLIDPEAERIYFVSNESYLYALEAKWRSGSF